MSHNKHRNSENTIFNGNPPEIEKLYNGRYRFTFRCTRDDNNTVWYHENREDLFAEFGDLSQTPYAKQGKGVTPPTGQTWPDLRLVKHGWVFIPQIAGPLLEFVYETLTDTYVQDRKEVVDYELNGLRRVTRTLTAKEGTDYGKVVGTDTISHTANGYGTVTLYLASVDDVDLDDDEGGFTRIREVWVEQGQLSETKTVESVGLTRVSRTYLVSAPVATNPVISESIQNYEGLQTITQVTFERSDGSPITDGQPTNTFGRMYNFTYPGVVGASSVTTTSLFGDSAVNRFFSQKSPVERPISATSYVFFQTESNPVAGDYTYNGASGLWSPSEWARGTYYGWRYQRDNFGTPIGESPSFRGFRVVENDSEIPNVVQSLSGTATDDDGLSGTLLLNGTTYSISVTGGPEKPDGNKYTLGVIDIQPAFIDVNGVQYYKKIITVATIPTQGGNVIT